MAYFFSGGWGGRVLLGEEEGGYSLQGAYFFNLDGEREGYSFGI